MTTELYFIFLACFVFLNIIALYFYFLKQEADVYGSVHDNFVPLTLKYAYPIQAFFLLAGTGALFYFSKEKTWFYESNFLYFAGLVLFCGVCGLFSNKSKAGKIVSLFLELGAITGFVFLLPENDFFKKFSLPLPLIQAITGLIWFIVYRFFCAITDRFDGMIVMQSIHMGFISLLILLLIPFTPVSLLQFIGLLFPLMALLTPFYCIFKCPLPLNACVCNIFCLVLTGMSFFAFPAGHWGVGVLIEGYLLFELVVFCFHFPFNLFRKDKTPVFFFEYLMLLSRSKVSTVNIIMRYNLLTEGMILFLLYLKAPLQIIALYILLFLKLYLNVTNPSSAYAGIIDLFKETKKTALKGFKETSQAFADVKKIYNQKKEKNKEKKDK